MIPQSSDFLDFFQLVGKSKKIPRTGWVMQKIKNPESVAEHSFRLSILAMVLSDKLSEELDRNKLIKMALLHDLGEVITGDLVVSRGEVIDIKKRDEKEKQEKEGIQKMFSPIGEDDTYTAIFNEMIARNTKEAQIFWQLDKLEMALQALEYENEHGKQLDEFFLNTEIALKDPFLVEIFSKIQRKRRSKK